MKLILSESDMKNSDGKAIKGHWDIYQGDKNNDNWIGHITKADSPDRFNIGVKFWPSKKFAKEYGMNIEFLTSLTEIMKKIKEESN